MYSKAATIILEQLGQGRGAEAVAIFGVISSPPVLNSETAYSAVMRAGDGYLQGFIRGEES